MSDLKPTPRSRVKRIPDRGRYDFDAIASILDAGFVCYLGYTFEGKPYVTPTLYWRGGAHVYWHGAPASRMLQTLGAGVDVCLTVAHVDGLVLARSAFHHSINYRSVMLFGKAEQVDEENAKAKALEEFVERLFPGRWAELRPMTAQELKVTTVLRMPIVEGSAKIRTGPPKDDEPDLSWPVWAGVLPVYAALGAPAPDDHLSGAAREARYLGDLAHLGLQRLK